MRNLYLTLVGLVAVLAATAQPFTENIVSLTDDLAISVFSSDLDQDGDIDILAAASGDAEIIWYENDGSENFTAHVIASNHVSARKAYTVDMDGDNDLDVLACSMDDNKISWHENDGSQNWTEHIISTTSMSVREAMPVDVDGDNDMDLVSASWSSGSVSWFENDGNENFTENVIGTATQALEVNWADIDGDNDIDVFAGTGSGGTLIWYENDGSENFTASNIATGLGVVFSIDIEDIDGDNDLDIATALYTGGNAVRWFDNDGSQNFTNTFVATVNSGTCVYIADVDGDNDMDLLSTSLSSDAVYWHENDGSQSFTTNTVSSNADGATCVFADDVNSDGAMDILSSSNIDDKIAWYENDCGGSIDASFTGLPAAACENDGAIVLTPATGGGTFTGPGMAGSTFDPMAAGPGTHIVSHEVTSGNCSGTEYDTILVSATPDTTVTIAGITLTAQTGGAVYQWLDCDNGDSPIAGETGQSFTPTANGNYALEITMGGCSDTSFCHAIMGVGIEEYTLDPGITLYPNPSSELVTITNNLSLVAQVQVFSADGRLIQRFQMAPSGSKDLNLSEWTRGTYFVHLVTEKSSHVAKLIRQ